MQRDVMSRDACLAPLVRVCLWRRHDVELSDNVQFNQASLSITLLATYYNALFVF